ncbi:YegS/Rv2252/BmrU family lipid kinase [bacterium C-53]|nr:YegS/Rv2252/BmrU family lipid kinase [Lachnospiraceae bacterium]NBI03674.1 YegS/Rv2252/BmrU family lipid kinase [Lachnospiraceae bacterium]RKJ09234.1 YegS/Rv2252/BmrU family lipid kinase [bacterium C-53]
MQYKILGGDENYMYYFIINPHACSGRGFSIWKEIEKDLKEKTVSYRHYFTRQTGDAGKYADKLTAGRKKITLVILGGDGTVNEVLNGIRDLSLVTLGYIPAGSSNDLARDLGVSRNIHQALNTVLHPTQTVLMDLGELICFDNGFLRKKRFAVSCGIGFDAGVCHEALHSRMKDALNRFHLGKLTYLGIALKQLIKAPKAECIIYPDSTAPVKLARFLFVTVMVHRYEGGGFKFCPDADYADGLINTCAVGNIPKWKIPFILPSGFTGNHLRYKGIQAYRSRSMRIVSDQKLPVHCDGESCGFHNEILVTCKKEQIHMIIG